MPDMSKRSILGLKRKRHGTRYRYTIGRCRCAKCTQANTDYQNERNRRLREEKTP